MKKFKKALSLLLVLCMSISVFACGSNVKKVTIATGEDKMKLNVVVSGASKANVQMVAAKKAQLAIIQNDVMTYAYNKTDMFVDDSNAPYTSFSAVASVYPESIQIIANKSITDISQLRGKRVSVGDAGSGVEFNAKQILEIYGMDIEKDIVKNNQSFADSCDALKNGTLDAAFITAGHPTVAVTELASNFDFNILSIDSAHARELINKYKFYAQINIEKDSYPVLTSDVQTVAVMATYIADNSLDEEQAHTRVVITDHRVEDALLGSLRDTNTIIRDTDGARG